MQNKMTYALIKMALIKGFRDIRENPRSGIKSLFDLGETFLSGDLQNELFSAAKKELENDDSIYYKIIQRTVDNTDIEALTTFALNLGYNCWSHGAELIRGKSERFGYAIPWCIAFELDGDGDGAAGFIADTMRQGQQLGALCYLFYFKNGQTPADRVLDIIKSNSDCAVMLFVGADAVTVSFKSRLKTLPHVLTALRGDTRVIKQAALSLKGCLYACCQSVPSSAAELEKLMAFTDGCGTSLLLLLDENSRAINSGSCKKVVSTARLNLKYPVVPICLPGDLAEIDDKLSIMPCRTTVDATGAVIINGRGTRFNVKSDRLSDVFQQAGRK